MRRGARVVAWGIGGVATTALAASAAVCLTSGCSTVGYYAQSVVGHLEILQAARPVPQVDADPATSAALKERLALSQRIRDFVDSDLMAGQLIRIRLDSNGILL